MNKNIALGLEIGISFFLAIGIGYGLYSYSQKKQNDAVHDSAVGVYERGNNVQPPPYVEPTDYSGSDEISGGRKKSKRRKGRKNASKKRR
jgi:hypothetical protein